MSGSLHRVALWLRLTLVCLVLTGVSAPAPAMGYREAVVAIAGATSRELAPPQQALPAPAPARSAALLEAGLKARPVAWPAPIVNAVAASISPLPPRRIFLLNRALLC
jgi:hypothetical protein